MCSLKNIRGEKNGGWQATGEGEEVSEVMKGECVDVGGVCVSEKVIVN